MRVPNCPALGRITRIGGFDLLWMTLESNTYPAVPRRRAKYEHYLDRMSNRNLA